MPWAVRVSRPIPSMHSGQTPWEFNDYSRGMDGFTGNDKFPLDNGGINKWRLAQDARIPTLGEYETRKGFDFHSVAAGETEDQSITGTTGAADQPINSTDWIAQKFTAGTSGRLSKVELNLKNDSSAQGTIIVEIRSDDSGEPGSLLAKSSIASSSVTGSATYLTARFAQAPTVTAAEVYWIAAYVQAVSVNSYEWTSTTTATTAMTSTDSGTSWASASFAMNFKQHYATAGGVKGLHRAYKSDGTSVTLFAHGTSLYSVNNSTGALTAIKTGLSASATTYRFKTVNDTVYYVNGFDGYRKWNFTTESQVSSTNYLNLELHKGLMFLQRADDPNRIDFSNFADYETFTSTDFIYSPAPKSAAVASLTSLNGYLVIRNREGNQILTGDDNATFRLDDAPDQKSTFSQESQTSDKNHQYFASDDGVYKSNGSQPILMSENIYEAYLRIQNKEGIVMTVNKGRLYMWYASAGSSVNDSCYVWNLNYSSDKDVVESHDTDAYADKVFSAYGDDDDLLVASSLIGQVYWQELSTNDYTNLGGDIHFLLQTHYNPYQFPAVEKEIRYWKARFEAQSGNYSIACEYAYDMRDNWTLYTNQSVQGTGYLWGDADTVWGAFTWGRTSETQANMYVPGQHRRTAVRYKHYAARQPHTFLGHNFVVQTKRMR